MGVFSESGPRRSFRYVLRPCDKYRARFCRSFGPLRGVVAHNGRPFFGTSLSGRDASTCTRYPCHGHTTFTPSPTNHVEYKFPLHYW